MLSCPRSTKTVKTVLSRVCHGYFLQSGLLAIFVCISYKCWDYKFKTPKPIVSYICWGIGNFSGAILLRQQSFQIMIGAYYVLIDTLLVSQFYLYGFRANRIATPAVHKSDLDEGDNQTEVYLL